MEATTVQAPPESPLAAAYRAALALINLEPNASKRAVRAHLLVERFDLYRKAKKDGESLTVANTLLKELTEFLGVGPPEASPPSERAKLAVGILIQNLSNEEGRRTVAKLTHSPKFGPQTWNDDPVVEVEAEDVEEEEEDDEEEDAEEDESEDAE
jgi:hypothetical protein